MKENNNENIAVGRLGVHPLGAWENRVYLDFYDLKEPPFSITPDPAFLFLSNTHQSVIDKILHGIKSRMGFILLTGEVGTGKTTICRSILDSLYGEAETAYIINPSLSGRELISNILDDFGIKYPPDSSKKVLIEHLNLFLLSIADTKPVVLIIDDAQTMSIAALEDLRLLSNLETDKAKLLQMVLVGQPELLDFISVPQMRQLRQRVAIHCNLEYITREEIDRY
ncbi:MAG: AAA family ATPase, partial [Methanosarcinaceae archaeon]|nr:AAA family ATPase [Methanosarcinaceae archaeon]